MTFKFCLPTEAEFSGLCILLNRASMFLLFPFSVEFLVLSSVFSLCIFNAQSYILHSYYFKPLFSDSQSCGHLPRFSLFPGHLMEKQQQKCKLLFKLLSHILSLEIC